MGSEGEGVERCNVYHALSNISLAPPEVVPQLYIGALEHAMSFNTLTSNGISHIVNLSGVPINFPNYMDQVTVPVDDKAQSNMLPFLPSIFEYIDQAVQGGGKVLVHCYAGVSRSSTVIIAYLLHSKQFPTVSAALARVRARRPEACPNPGFSQQLAWLQQSAGCPQRAQSLRLLHRGHALYLVARQRMTDSGSYGGKGLYT